MQLTKEEKRAEMLKSLGLKRSNNKPIAFPKEGILSGVINGFTTVEVKDDQKKGEVKDVLVMLFNNAETKEDQRIWVDAGLRTSLGFAKVVEFPETLIPAELAAGAKIVYTGTLAIEHEGMIEIDGGRSVNQYAIFTQEN